MKREWIFYLSAMLSVVACGGKTQKKASSSSHKEKSELISEEGNDKPINKTKKTYSDMVYIPAGAFIMGTDPKKEKEYPPSYGFPPNNYHDELPQRKVYLKGFYIDKYEVTIAKYANFVKATGRKLPEALRDLDFEKYKNYPVNYVDWHDAYDYAEWAGKKLPTEAQWEKAARGTEGRTYPWGNTFDETKANFSQESLVAVGTYKEDVSPYGVYGMAGNVDEWIADRYLPYPEHDPDCRDDHSEFEESQRAYRGCSWGQRGGHLKLFDYFSRAARRGHISADFKGEQSGFRCVQSG